MGMTIQITDISPSLPSSVFKCNHPYSIYEGAQRLTLLEERAQETQTAGKVTIQIFEDNESEATYHDDMYIGEDNGYALISYVEERLKVLFPENEGDIAILIEKLTDAYTYDTRQTEMIEPTVQVVQEHVEAEPIIPVTSTKETPKGTKKPVEVRQSVKQTRKVQRPSIRLSRKKVGIVLGTALGVLLITIAIIFSVAAYQSKSLAEEEPPNEAVQQKYAAFIRDKKYTDAAKTSPERVLEIENLIVEQGDIAALRTFQAAYPTTEGAFDIACLEKRWDKVITYQKAEQTKERQYMLAFSYLKVGNVGEAEKRNVALKSNTMKKLISDYRILTNNIAISESNLKKAGLSVAEKQSIASNLKEYKAQLETLGEE
ncbi:hypothetical protein HCJ39_07045 [Listeria rocourtiae]|uniref:hypothetical protein n=1 Tax=Listeria rocourtiae TaxID=647910 RepID=UPI001628BF27|nr:hypothetical protein [Listeria rocourtiae]MBC1604466.1 hypothetical protein [Listeria rocourtiae]